MPEHFEIHVPVEAPGDNPVALLHAACSLSRQQIKTAMAQGAVWITRGSQSQRLRRAKRAVQPGDMLHLYYDAAIQAEDPPPPVLIADTCGYSVWNKPRGLRSQGSKWGDHCTVARWAEQHLVPQRTGFTVHRLDRAAAGLMLVAHSKKVAADLSRLFRQRRIEKRYRAVVAGGLQAPLSPLRITQALDGKSAVSELRVLAEAPDGTRTLIDVRIESGRKHQIRRHLAGIGHPIVGDRLYGGASGDDVDLQLTAYLLAFECPVTNQPVKYELPECNLPGLASPALP
jgi:tRNA pseudouridine32 synthase/23S rRNA pseudouridine746 synthase